jgi:hypothetical protein
MRNTESRDILMGLMGPMCPMSSMCRMPLRRGFSLPHLLKIRLDPFDHAIRILFVDILAHDTVEFA